MGKATRRKRPIPTNDPFSETVAEVLDIAEEIVAGLEAHWKRLEGGQAGYSCGFYAPEKEDGLKLIARYRALVPKQEEVSPSSGEEAFEAGRREGRRASPTRTSFLVQGEETIPF